MKRKPKTLEERQLASLDKQLDAIKNPVQQRVISKNRSSKGWALGYVSAWGARKAIRKLRKR